MFVNIEGKGRVFAKERDGWTSYTLGVSSKDKSDLKAAKECQTERISNSKRSRQWLKEPLTGKTGTISCGRFLNSLRKARRKKVSRTI